MEDQLNERMTKIWIKAQATNLLLESYNEIKMNEFMAAKDNILLVEYFLQNKKQFILGSSYMAADRRRVEQGAKSD